MRLMKRLRESIRNDCFPEFVKKFIRNYYLSPSGNVSKVLDRDSDKSQEAKIPDWVVNALKEVNINVLEE